MKQKRCTYCFSNKHNIRTCQSLRSSLSKEANERKRLGLPVESGRMYQKYNFHFEKKQTSKTPRKCSFCRQVGHTKKNCTAWEQTYADAIKKNKDFRTFVREELFIKAGMNLGSIIYAPRRMNSNPYGVLSPKTLSTMEVFDPSLSSVEGFLKKELVVLDCYIIVGFDFHKMNYNGSWNSIFVSPLHKGSLIKGVSIKLPFSLEDEHPPEKALEDGLYPYTNRTKRIQKLLLNYSFEDFIVVSPTPYDEKIIPKDWENDYKGLKSLD